MAAESSWSLRGVDPRARERAREAAKREGVTIGEWLNRQLLETGGDAGQGEYSGGGSGAYDDPEALAHVIDRLSRRIEAAEHRSTLAITGIDQSVLGIMSRLQSAEEIQQGFEERYAAALDELRQTQDALQARITHMETEGEEDESGLEALKSLEQALTKIANQVRDSEAQTKTRFESLKADLERAADGSGQRIEQVSRALDARLADVERKVEHDLSDAASRVAREAEDTARKLGRDVEALAHKLEKDVRALREEAAQNRGALEARLAEQAEAGRAQISDLEALSKQLESDVAAARDAADQARELIEARLAEHAGASSAQINDLEALGKQLESDVAAARDAADQTRDLIEARLAEHAETSRDQAKEEIGQQIESSLADAMSNVTDRLGAAELATDQAIKGLERSFAELEERVKRAEEHIGDSDDVASREAFAKAVESRFDALSQELSDVVAGTRAEIANKMVEVAHKDDTTTFDAKLAELARQVDASEAKQRRMIERISHEVSKVAGAVEARVRAGEAQTNKGIAALKNSTARIEATAKDAAKTAAEAKAAAEHGAGGDEQLSEEFAQLNARLGDAETKAAAAIAAVTRRMDSLDERLSTRSEGADDLAQRIRESEERTRAMVDGALAEINRRLDHSDDQTATVLSPVQRALDTLRTRLERLETGGAGPPPPLTDEPALESADTPLLLDDEFLADASDADAPMDTGFDLDDGLAAAPEFVAEESFEPAFDVDTDIADILSDLDLNIDDLDSGADIDADIGALADAPAEDADAETLDDPLRGESAFVPEFDEALRALEAEADLGAPGRPHADHAAEPAGVEAPEDASLDLIIEDDLDALGSEAGAADAADPEADFDFVLGRTMDEPVDMDEADAAVSEVDAPSALDPFADAPEHRGKPPVDDFLAAARDAARRGDGKAGGDARAAPGFGPAAEPAAAKTKKGRSFLVAASGLAFIAVGAAGYIVLRDSARDPNPEDTAAGPPEGLFVEPGGQEALAVSAPASSGLTPSAETTAPPAPAAPPVERSIDAAGAFGEPRIPVSVEPSADDDFSLYADGGAPFAPIRPETPAPGEAFDAMLDAAIATAGGATAPAGPPPVAVDRDLSADIVAPSPAPAPTTEADAVAPAASEPLTLESAAEQGDPVAQYQLGAAQLEDGELVDGVRLIRQAAENGLAAAQYRLGKLYEAGRGVEPDAAEARRWTERAANAGHRNAMHNLGIFYAEGRGASQDFAEAARWFEEAALLGATDSQFNLAVLYEQGLGVSTSLPDAYTWFSIAARSGDGDAEERARGVGGRLTPEARERADTAAARFSPRPLDEAANGIFRDTPWSGGAIDARAAIARAQAALTRLGYAPGPADGMMGAMTASAIKAYQSDNGLAPTGEVDASLLEKLEADAAAL